MSSEPADTEERPIIGSHLFEKAVAGVESGDSDFDRVPEEKIPSSGHGNSEDGSAWLNPSAAQLYRACRRKNKGLEKEDAPAMHETHVAVTESTWAQIMEYENLHSSSCPNPTLARFWGMYGQHTYKARMMHLLGYDYPFDRHDWVVSRCGKEVRYIIDYHSLNTVDEEGNESMDYFIDVRPALTFGGISDRLRMTYYRWRNGESTW